MLVDPVSRAQKRALVLDALRRLPASTTAELDAVLPSLNPALVRGTLGELRREGLVRGRQQGDGPYNRWYLIE